MIVIGVDPGFTQSAYVMFNGESVGEHDIVDNAVMLTRLETWKSDVPVLGGRVLVVEQIAMGGMIAGASIFETCFWSGRFVEMFSPKRWDRVKRKDVKMHLCGQVRAKDGNIRQALIDRFGPDPLKAIGNKKAPGPLYGIASHEWAALAVAVTWYDRCCHLPETIRPNVVPEF